MHGNVREHNFSITPELHVCSSGFVSGAACKQVQHGTSHLQTAQLASHEPYYFV